MKMILKLIITLIVCVNIANAANVHNSEYLLKIDSIEKEKRESVDVSSVALLFVLSSIGVYTFLTSDITIRKLSKNEYISIVSSIENQIYSGKAVTDKSF